MNKNLLNPGQIITFYSYKGGSGRSMALANVSCLLSEDLINSDQKILVIDWDLEAPGLHKFLSAYSDNEVDWNRPGLINYFHDLEKLLKKKPGLYEKIISKDGMEVLDKIIPLENYIISEPLHGLDFIQAGRFDPDYTELVNSFDWLKFYNEYRFIFNVFKELISSQYAYCLIDSRTGITDTSGICSMIMPEKLVTVFTPNLQSLHGLLDLIRKAVEYRRKSDDFRPLAVFPLPSRIDIAEKELKDEWRLKYQNEFGLLFRKLYELKRCDLSTYFDQVQLPHVSYYSFGEKIAVREEYQEEVFSLSEAYERFLIYLTEFDFAWQELERMESVFPTGQKKSIIKEFTKYPKKLQEPIRVFISSTYTDLIEYRQAAIEVANRYKLAPVAMEFFCSQPTEPEIVCKKEIEECDIFIGIYAHRYGYIPEGNKKSITQQEYELARELNKDCLCFVVDKDFSWPVKMVEMDNYDKHEAFIDQIKKEIVISFFTTVSNFTIRFSTSLGIYIQRKKERGGTKDFTGSKHIFIPLLPTPYVAHPYAFPGNFTGREAEQALLSNWFLNEPEPVLVMEAIGGMGKTALSWVWLHQRIIEAGIEVVGIFWWSFYEADFDCFLREITCYVFGGEAKPEEVTPDHFPRLLAALHSRRFLLIMDGFERALHGYVGMDVMYRQEKGLPGKKEDEDWERRQRETVHPVAGKFLRLLTTGNTKTLITTRLLPVSLEGFSSVKHIFLKGFNPADAVVFFQSEGIRGTRAELEQAGEVYDNHPLMLKLLTSAIKRSRNKDIKDAYKLKLIDKKEPQKILTASYNLLSGEEQRVVSHIAVFRGIFTFDSIKAIFPDDDEDLLWQTLKELCQLGFLFYDEKEDRFDFHPILRAYLYARLSGRKKVHQQAVEYFRALPKPEKIISLHDLEPGIELYHHLVKGGKYDEACELYRGWIHDTVYYQLSDYSLPIELLKEFFSKGEDHLPQLKEKHAQAWVLNTLANAYARNGQPSKAVPLYFSQLIIQEENNDKKDLALGLGNIAGMVQIPLSRFSASASHLHKAIAFCRETGDVQIESFCRIELGHILSYQDKSGLLKVSNPNNKESINADNEFDIAFKFFEKKNSFHSLSKISSHRTLNALFQARLSAVLKELKRSKNFSLDALNQAKTALSFAEQAAKKDRPFQRDFVRTYWLLGETAIQCRLSEAIPKNEPFDINFFDEHFQHITDSITWQSGKELETAERCLDEALRRSRRLNIVDIEPDILLAIARLKFEKTKSISQKKVSENLEDIGRLLSEAHDISIRPEFRLKLADIHLFCASVLLKIKEAKILLLLTASEHLQKAKEYALDVSEFSHLYQSQNPHFYDGIPKYQMLKRGMTEEERIKSGYWIVYKMAEALEGEKVDK